MILIAHRGNTNGPNGVSENTPDYIDEALDQGYDAEIDVWSTRHGIYLGHDYPNYQINIKWLQDRADKLWIHCKNIDAMSELHEHFNVFFHNVDDYTLTSKNYIWAYPGKSVPPNSRAIAVLKNEMINISNFAGICTDYVSRY